MKKRNSVVAILVGLFLFLATACGGGSSNGDSGTGESGGGAVGDKFDFKLATMYPEEHADVKSLHRAIEKISAETDGNLNIKVYPSNQLGDYQQVYEEVMKGTIDMGTITIPSTFDPRLEMLTMPYLVTSFDEAKELYAPGSEFFNALVDIQRESGVETLNIYLDGFMGMGTTKPVSDPMDPTVKKPQLIRTPAIDSYVWTAQAMGYNTTTIPYADLYSALQTGVADGWFGGSAYVNMTSFGDVVKYFYEERYMMELIVTVVNVDKFNSLPEEYQTLLRDTFAAEALVVADEREKLDAQAMEDMKAAGIEVYVPTQAEFDAMAEHIQAEVWPKYEEVLGPELLAILMESK